MQKEVGNSLYFQSQLSRGKESQNWSHMINQTALVTDWQHQPQEKHTILANFKCSDSDFSWVAS
jgi:hypothetical protein